MLGGDERPARRVGDVAACAVCDTPHVRLVWALVWGEGLCVGCWLWANGFLIQA